MAKTTQVQDQTMEEILASIRRIISDDEAKPSVAPARPTSNVSHLFAEPAPRPLGNVVELPIEPHAPLPHYDDDVDYEDEAQGSESGRDIAAIDAAAFAAALQSTMNSEPPPAPAPAPARQIAASDAMLLSARADAAVNSAFGNLTDSFFAGNGRTVESLVEDMLRPMLKTWLDNNLPPLVERLVKEEIERVSRRRR